MKEAGDHSLLEGLAGSNRPATDKSSKVGLLFTIYPIRVEEQTEVRVCVL